MAKTPMVVARITCAIAVAAGGVVGSLKLMWSHDIGQFTFCFLIGVSALVALAIAFGDRLESIGLRDLKIQLGKIESARQDVVRREQEVRRIALSLAEITMFLAAFHRRLGNEETQSIENEWFRRKVEELLQMVDPTSTERDKVFRFADAVRRMDAMRETNPSALNTEWEEMWKRIKNETTSYTIDSPIS